MSVSDAYLLAAAIALVAALFVLLLWLARE